MNDERLQEILNGLQENQKKIHDFFSVWCKELENTIEEHKRGKGHL